MILSRRVLLGSTLATLIAHHPERRAPSEPPVPEAPPRRLVAQKAQVRLMPTAAPETDILGFDGTAPGPLLRCKLGDGLAIRLVNQTDQPLTLANWGLRIPNALDGVAPLTQKPVPPGNSYDYTLKPVDAGLFGYRSFVAPDAGNQLRHGLYGALIVDEVDPPPADKDIVAILSDWQLDAKTQILASAQAGMSLATLNSRPLATEETYKPGSRIRLRLLNAAASRLLFVAFENVSPHVLAIDGQPCAAFSPGGNLLPIGPGGRFDVMFDLPDKSGTARLLLREDATHDRPLMVFRTEGNKWPDIDPIPNLPPNPLLPAKIQLEAARNVQINVSGGGAAPFSLNGTAAKDFDKAPLFSIKRGAPATLALVNKSSAAQQMRVHGHALRILHDLDDGWDPYWRDSVIAPPGHTKHIAFVADNSGKWAIEMLPLDVPAADMVTWFEVS
ncbi:MAG: multicopper oxidase domain-containing protein [Methylovirgula sp.]|uniref:multicopper oxidase family protein n=1 Tax=Methylovirgula sp. TaxID=1978224 RepID=UPI00307602E5